MSKELRIADFVDEDGGEAGAGGVNKMAATNRCNHCDAECNSSFDICGACWEAGHSLSGECLACRRGLEAADVEVEASRTSFPARTSL